MENTNDKTAVQLIEAIAKLDPRIVTAESCKAVAQKWLNTQRTAGGDAVAWALQRTDKPNEYGPSLFATRDSAAENLAKQGPGCVPCKVVGLAPVAEAAVQAPIGYTSAHDLRKLSHPGNSRSIDVEANPSPDADIPVFAGTVQAAAQADDSINLPPPASNWPGFPAPGTDYFTKPQIIQAIRDVQLSAARTAQPTLPTLPGHIAVTGEVSREEAFKAAQDGDTVLLKKPSADKAVVFRPTPPDDERVAITDDEINEIFAGYYSRHDDHMDTIGFARAVIRAALRQPGALVDDFTTALKRQAQGAADFAAMVAAKQAGKERA